MNDNSNSIVKSGNAIIKKQPLVMVTDDDPDSALSVQMHLEDSGYRVKTYTNPLKALSEFKNFHYDLVLLDVKMPGMDGFQLYQRLKKIDKSCKVCFITAFEIYYKSLKEFYPNLDVTCFIQKPVTRKKLLKIVEQEINS